MGMIMWMGGPILIMVLLWIYLFFRVRRTAGELGLKGRGKEGLALAVSTAIALPILGFWGKAGIWAILVIHFGVFLVLFDLIHGLIYRVRKRESRTWRVIHRFGLLPLLCTGAVFVYGHYNIAHVVENGYTVTTEKAIRAEGYRVAVLSDMHYGLLDNREDMQRMVGELSEKQVDLVLLCGDLVDERTTLEQVNDLFAMLGQIKSSFGVYFVYGNHDPAQYSSAPNYTVAELEEAMSSNGITVLEDETAAITQDLLLVGRKDRSSPRLSVEELLEGADKSAYILLADHQPYELSLKAEAGVDLQVSGHTHAGQLFPVGFFNELTPDSMNYGIEQFGEMQSVVTSGVTGWGYALRTQGPSEYVLIDILPE